MKTIINQEIECFVKTSYSYLHIEGWLEDYARGQSLKPDEGGSL